MYSEDSIDEATHFEKEAGHGCEEYWTMRSDKQFYKKSHI